MAYFPFFVDLEGREGLVAGGGAVALRKLQKLLPYGPRLTAAAPELLPEIAALPGVELLRQPFAPWMLEGKFFVVAATDAREDNHRIAALCQERGILVNVADDREACTFLFPALVRRGSFSAGISTGGASPTGAVWVKERLEALLPENFGQLLAWLEALRPTIKAALPEEKDRAAFFAGLFGRCLALGRPLTDQELAVLLADAGKGGAP